MSTVLRPPTSTEEQRATVIAILASNDFDTVAKASFLPVTWQVQVWDSKPCTVRNWGQCTRRPCVTVIYS